LIVSKVKHCLEGLKGDIEYVIFDKYGEIVDLSTGLDKSLLHKIPVIIFTGFITVFVLLLPIMPTENKLTLVSDNLYFDKTETSNAQWEKFEAELVDEGKDSELLKSAGRHTTKRTDRVLRGSTNNSIHRNFSFNNINKSEQGIISIK